MKYINKLTLGIVLAAGLFTACSDDDDIEIPGGLALDKQEIEIGPQGGTESIAVLASQDWVANTSEPWLMLSPANGVGSVEGTIKVDSTLSNTLRSTELQFVGANGQRCKLTVTQFGYGKQIFLKEPTVEIENTDSYDNRSFQSVISANVECKIGKIEYSYEGDLTEEEKADNTKELEGWLLNSKDENKLVGTNLGIVLDKKYRPRSVNFKFRWAMNIVPVTRVAKVHLVPANAEDQLVDTNGNPTGEVVLTVRQKPALKIEDNRAGDSLSIIMINQKLGCMATFDTSDNMRNWSSVSLWESTDAFVKEHPEALGRVRSVKFSMFNLKTGEKLPKEVRNLKFMETFSLASNENNQIREVELGEDICELKYLKNLIVQAYGMTKLPANFAKLGQSLESLNLVSNNFNKLSDITNVINETNFPKLRNFTFYAQRRNDVIIDLSTLNKNGDGDYVYNNNTIGLYGKVSAGTADRYSRADFSEDKADYRDKLVGDTCKWLLSGWDNPVTCKHKDGSVVCEEVCPPDVPRVLPNCRRFSINLNFFTGDVPKWILFHPHLVEWSPAIMVFNQQPRGKNSTGQAVGFSNMTEENFSLNYYYGTSDPGTQWNVPGVAYPLYYRAYVAAGDVEEASVMVMYKR